MVWKNPNKSEKILKIIQIFPQWPVSRELTKNGMIDYVIWSGKIQINPKEFQKLSKNSHNGWLTRN